MAKRLFKVTILFCFIISLFCITSFALDLNYPPVYYKNDTISSSDLTSYGTYLDLPGNTDYVLGIRFSSDAKLAFYQSGNGYAFLFVSKSYDGNTNLVTHYNYPSTTAYGNQTQARQQLGDYYYWVFDDNILSNLPVNYNFLSYQSLNDAINDLANIYGDIDPDPVFIKNPNVDKFLANTLISMGVKFDNPAYALSYASDAWDWCIDDENMESANAFDEWNIESFVSYCNAQSNNYLNWYNGYKVSKDVTNALGEYIRQNIQLLSGLPSGITSLTSAYMPIYHYGSGFQSGVSSPTAQTFYPAQTITYFNGEYVAETDDISTSQFLYSPADVRRFLGYPGSSPVITPSSPTGTGTITDDPNNSDQKNININFPALDWLADAIKSILDFLRDAFTTLANLLTQLLDAILGLFSDAFESLSDFGQGIIEWLYAIVAGFSEIGGNYIPVSLWAVILPFILINIGVGLIMFVLRSH